MQHLTDIFERINFCAYGAPQKFIVDPELCIPIMKALLDRYEIKLLSRPSRSSHMNGLVETDDGVFEAILEILEKSGADGIARSLVSLASFFISMFRLLKLMSSFFLLRGYNSLLIVLPASLVTKTIMNSHVQREATRSLE